MPPTWLKKALNGALKSPNKIAHSPTIPILNQYCEQSPGKAINFAPLYCIATFFLLLYYMYHHLLLKIIALFDSQLRRARWLRFFTVDDPAYPLLANSAPTFLQIFTKRLQHSQTYFSLLCTSKEESLTVNYWTRHIKRPPGAKRPPTTDGAERLTLSRGRHPTPPTISAGMTSLLLTSLQIVVSAAAD